MRRYKNISHNLNCSCRNKGKGNRAEKIFEELIAENFADLVIDIHL